MTYPPMTLIRAIIAIAVLAAAPAAAEPTLAPTLANVIDGADERGSLLEIGPSLGLSSGEIARIREVAGHVACTDPEPVTATGALFLTNGQILTAAHTFFQANGERRSRCFFRQQMAGSEWLPLADGSGNVRFGARAPKPGSNNDWAVVRLAAPVGGVRPFAPDPTRPAAGDRLIVVSAQPVGFEHIDPNVPVVQPCSVRRAPVSSAATSFYRSDCDAGQGSSGGMHLFRIGGELVFRGMTISTGPSRDPAFLGAPYDEQGGSVTTALGTDAAILAAARELAGQ